MSASQLLACRMCGNPVSQSVKVCPRCAAPNPSPGTSVREGNDIHRLRAGLVSLSILASALAMAICR